MNAAALMSSLISGATPALGGANPAAEGGATGPAGAGAAVGGVAATETFALTLAGLIQGVQAGAVATGVDGSKVTGQAQAQAGATPSPGAHKASAKHGDATLQASLAEQRAASGETIVVPAVVPGVSFTFGESTSATNGLKSPGLTDEAADVAAEGVPVYGALAMLTPAVAEPLIARPFGDTASELTGELAGSSGVATSGASTEDATATAAPAPVQAQAPAPASASATDVAPHAAAAAGLPQQAADAALLAHARNEAKPQASAAVSQAAATPGHGRTAAEALAATPAPTRSQAPQHTGRASPHPLIQAITALKGETTAAAPTPVEADVAPAPAAAALAAAPAALDSPDAAVAAALAPQAPVGDEQSAATASNGKLDAKAGVTVEAQAEAKGEAPSATDAKPAAAAKTGDTPAVVTRGAVAVTEAVAESGLLETVDDTAVLELAHAEAARTETPASAPLQDAARGAPETVARLAAQMIRKLEARNTRFELALDPAGLGAVQVSLEINAQGELHAHMAFERPEAASELRGRAQELQRALEQAGFDLGQDALSFEHGGRREFAGQGDQQRQDRPGAHQARAFEAALRNADSADFAPARPIRFSQARLGLDLTI